MCFFKVYSTIDSEARKSIRRWLFFNEIFSHIIKGVYYLFIITNCWLPPKDQPEKPIDEAFLILLNVLQAGRLEPWLYLRISEGVSRSEEGI